jgi:uncharacterized Zn-binding protein involved in type VI secretion
MAYGAEFYNDSGKVQLSSEVSNFYMAEKGTITLSTSTSTITITPTVSYDAIALVIEGGTIIPGEMYATTVAANTSKTFTVRGTSATGSGPSGAVIKWYAFRSYRHLSPATTGHGMEIYTSTGQVAFSSLYPQIMKGFKIPISSASTLDTPLDSSKTYAFISYGTSRGIGTYSEPMGGGATLTGNRNLMTIKTSSSNIRVIFSSPRTSPAAFPAAFSGGLIALDVTNY